MKIDVVYLCGGKGIRAGLGFPKQFAYIGGKPIMIHGLETLQSMDIIGNIIIPTCDEIKVLQLCKQYQITKAELCLGGKNRQASVKSGLQCVTTKSVLIMEGVRPFVTAEFIERVAKTYGAFVTPITPAVSTVLTRGGEYLDRDMIGEVQMPQKYYTKLLVDAHNHTTLDNATDDAALVLQTTSAKPKIIDGLLGNIKITTPLDLKIAEAIYECNNNGE